MSFGGFGASPGDFVLLVQLARRTLRNCQQAGDEYAEIGLELRCLHSVLRTVRKLAEQPDSAILRQDRATTAQLTRCADGCKHVLDELDDMLAKYATLDGEGQPSVGKKMWQRFRFGSNIQELGVVRGKLITYTSTISILIDTMQSEALDRVETKIDDGFGEVRGEFERMRKEILKMATQARASNKNGSSLSLLSLSTYAGDEKEIWKAFRRELIEKGFRSRSLDKYGHVLQAYMLKLDQSGLLDNTQTQEPTSAEGTLWWTNRVFANTFVSLSRISEKVSAEERGTAMGVSLPPVVVVTPGPSPTGTKAETGSEDVDGLLETLRYKSTDMQDVPCPRKTSPARRKVAFATISISRRGGHGKGKAARSTKSILRQPTRRFPEDPNYLREGVALWEEAVGGKVPPSARITKLDRKDVDITAVHWLIPRCEKMEDHVVVFKTLEDADIAFFTDLTALFRDELTKRYTVEKMAQIAESNAEVFGGLLKLQHDSKIFLSKMDSKVLDDRLVDIVVKNSIRYLGKEIQGKEFKMPDNPQTRNHRIFQRYTDIETKSIDLIDVLFLRF
ncbi:hypothetical protein N431DRAFT_551882 [Stipitochalara longipes BDJ]|nr:hypothetical protein N431DRAFT_551882 [Stipitochalara longipes BDJ]